MLDFFRNTNLSSELSQKQNEDTYQTQLEYSDRTNVTTIKREIYEMCQGCGRKIEDRFIMKISDRSWHENCVLCCTCGTVLNGKCYIKNMKLYCKSDYEKLFRVCGRCSDPLQSSDMVMKVQKHYVFHLHCFTCCECGQPLQKGDQYMVRGGRLLCKDDIDADFYLSSHCGGTDDYLYEGSRHKDGRRGPKRPRTILTSAQRRQFKASFEMSPKPSRKIRETLAKDTGLSVRVVQVWFQNQRAKIKKIQRKSGRGGGGDSKSDKETGDEKSSKQCSPNSESGMYIGLDRYNSTKPLNPNMPYSPDDYPDHSNDSFSSSDDSLDDSNFDHLDEATSDTVSLHNLEIHHQLSAHNHSNHHLIENVMLPGDFINPIDKLCLMQNSYFNSDQ